MSDRRRPANERWDATTVRLVDYMIDCEVRQVPADALGDLQPDAEQMVEAEVLVRTAEGYAFFHDGYFDFLAAQRFLAGGRPLPDVILASEQGLIRRPLVRQVLQALREEDSGRYLDSVRTLLSREDVRFHIKDVVLSVLAANPKPRLEEWEAIVDLVEDPTARGHARAWRVVAQPQWFDLLDSVGTVARWLDSDDEGQVDLAVSLLRAVDQQRPRRVAELAGSKLGHSAQWDRRLRWLISWSDLSSDPGFVDIASYVLDHGLAEDDQGRLQPDDLLASAHRLPETNPDGAVRLFSALFHRAWQMAQKSDSTDPFDWREGRLRASDHEALLRRAAERAPAAFVRELLPLMIEMANANRSSRNPPYRDTIWGYRHVGERDDLKDRWLDGMTVALAQLASDEPAGFAQAANLLTEHDELETALLLLYRAWRAAPSQYADEALRFVAGADERLAVGYADHYYWETEQLIAAVAEHASDAELRRTEAFLLGFYSWWERHPEGRKDAGLAQAGLLSAIPEHRRSAEVVKRLKEATERFTERRIRREPEPIRVGFVRSPIDAPDAEQMNNEQWLAAIEKYSGSGDRDFSDILRGGAHELAQVMEALTKQHPERFARLIQAVPDEANSEYFDAVLRGIGSTDEAVEPETAFAVVRRCHALPTRPCGRWIGDPVVRFADRFIPADVIEILSWYMTQDPDPERDIWHPDEPTVYYGGDVHMAGINSARGSAAEDIGRLLWAEPGRLAVVRDALAVASDDEVLAVRSCVAEALLAVLAHEREYALTLFNRLVDADDDLLATRPVEHFLRWAAQTDLTAVRPLIRRMMASELVAAKRAGARQACLAALGDADASDLAEATLVGDATCRLGAAEVFAANVKQAAYREICITSLKRLFDDDVPEVRSEAADCFRQFNDAELGQIRELVVAFIGSKAFADGYDDLLFSLQESTADLSEESIAAGEAYINMLVEGPTAQRAARHTTTLSTVILRAYNRTAVPALKERALDVIDALLAGQSYGIDSALAQYEDS